MEKTVKPQDGQGQAQTAPRQIRLLVVENDQDRSHAIKRIFDVASGARFDIEFRAFAQTAGFSAMSFTYNAAVVDFTSDPKAAALAAWRLRSISQEMGIAVIAPSGEFLVPVEVLELGLGPFVAWDDDGIASMPQMVLAMAEPGSGASSGIASQNVLRQRHQELRDITDSLARQSVHLIHLRNELAAEKSKLETIINGMTDGVVFFDISGKLETINPVASALFPYLALGDEAKEQFVSRLMEGRQGELKTGGYFDATITGRIYRVRVTEVAGAEGGPAGSLVMLTDITQDKEYERLKNDFTSMISHELRTPLTSIRAAVDNFMSGNLGDVTERQIRFLEMIKRNVERQQALIDDLLDLAKFEAGQMELVLEHVNPVTVTQFCVDQFSLAFRDKGITLELSHDGAVREMAIDQRLFSQGVNNLLSNALKFTGEGGGVSVSLSVAKAGGEEMLRIAVADTGIGIPRDQAQRIFDKYTQLDSSTRRRYPGTGLGLAVVREIVKAHGGNVAVESEPGKGSVFTMLLPITRRGK
ncbi:MAG: hypothetical protein HY751_10575 [Nitrospinae bacterium]|nr:hypothetical protein [Nitrospinota bacterium]